MYINIRMFFGIDSVWSLQVHNFNLIRWSLLIFLDSGVFDLLLFLSFFCHPFGGRGSLQEICGGLAIGLFVGFARTPHSVAAHGISSRGTWQVLHDALYISGSAEGGSSLPLKNQNLKPNTCRLHAHTTIPTKNDQFLVQGPLRECRSSLARRFWASLFPCTMCMHFWCNQSASGVTVMINKHKNKNTGETLCRLHTKQKQNKIDVIALCSPTDFVCVCFVTITVLLFGVQDIRGVIDVRR